MEATLVYPHQLYNPHPAIAPGRPVFLIEDPLFFGNDPHWPTAMHRQKLVLHRASMRGFAEELREAGHKVELVECPDGSGLDSAALLETVIPESCRRLFLTDPTDTILERRVRRFGVSRGLELDILPSPNFLSPAGFLEEHVAGRKKPFMARFYEAQRKRLGLLMDDEGGPLGGQWSFDVDNRRKMPKDHPVPPPPEAPGNPHRDEAITSIARRFPDNPGKLDGFRWPVTRSDASAWLDTFLDQRFAEFGPYEDAISTRHAFLFHSAITPALNIGLLDPRDVLDRVLARASRAAIPLNSLEGFVRQVVGWREFMHGIYRHRGTDIRNGNFWQFERPMPAAFYDGTTGIPPVDRVIRQVLDEGWCHHIERLMILGNFMLLCRIRPDDVYRWFMELFVDAYDWVMVPNVYGMSQFADGGTFTTKPYLSGSNYVLKMSDEPRGPWCPIWDGLFWTFIADHRAFFLENPRLSMMARSWEKQSVSTQEGHRQAAAGFLEGLG